MILLDIEKAYDTVWYNGLIHKLIESKLPEYLVHIIKSYISNRTFYVQINSKYSKMQSIPAGVPQGSCLSPILYNLYVNDIPVESNTSIYLYADDTAITSTSYRTDTITNRLQKAYHRLKTFYNKWKIKINDEKTQTILFTKRRPLIDRNILNFSWSTKIKYLGVYLDNKLTFTHHIDYTCNRALKTLCIMYPYFNRTSSLSISNKITLFKLCILPILLYASPVWSSTANYNNRKLQIIQNKCLRIINNYEYFTKIRTMHDNLNIKYIKDIIFSISEKFLNRCQNCPNPLISNIGNYNRNTLRRFIKERNISIFPELMY